jgi:hypothetical protein
MLVIILPTTDIVNEYSEYESLFCFYRDGIKGLVRDVIAQCNSTELRDEDHWYGFKDLVVGEYYASMHRRYVENTHTSAHRDFIIEMVVEKVAHDVEELMQRFFNQLRYDVQRTDKWIGNDLLAAIQLAGYDHPGIHGTRTPRF